MNSVLGRAETSMARADCGLSMVEKKAREGERERDGQVGSYGSQYKL